MNFRTPTQFRRAAGRLLRSLAMPIIILSVSACGMSQPERFGSSKYSKTADAVYFWRGNSDTVGCHYIVPKADPSTFVPLGYDYGKDAKNVFFQDSYLECADVGSFQATGDGEAKDKNHSYHEDQIKEADGTYRASGSGQGYVIDSKKNTVYFESDGALYGADAKTFVVLASGYAKDRNHVYFGADRLSADPASFKTEGPFGLDKSGAWFETEHIDGLGTHGLKVSGQYITDGKRVFFGSDIYSGARAIADAEVPADVSSFRSIGGSYGVDRKRLYFQDLPVFRKVGSRYQPVNPSTVALAPILVVNFLSIGQRKKSFIASGFMTYHANFVASARRSPS